MAEINIQSKQVNEGWAFQVKVTEGSSSTTHDVTLSEATHEKLCGGVLAPNEFIKRSFEFLLDREPKESIMSRFDVTVISTYFPEFESWMQKKI